MDNTPTDGATYPVTAVEVTRKFGKKVALEKVSLTVPRGCVFGLVGENGAGKTTLIKLALGLLKPTEGSVRVFGFDPVADPPGALSRIGYLSEDHDLPLWMRVDELMNYTQAFYPKWDPAFAEELRETFELDPSAKIKHLSRGQRAQAGLLAAMAHRPELLLLDEPSSGLDPVVRRDILSAIIRTVAEEGRTVLFSSHLLEEVERVADIVAMIHQGRIVLCGSLDDVKSGYHRLTLRFREPQTTRPSMTGALWCEGRGREWTVLCDGRLEELRAAAASLGAEIVEEHAPSLEDIFVARVGKRVLPAGKE
ncbi:MAG: ABC transporter ATP-binding protein [Candidatus Hydrogenedentes bacterium]|nr:ABC transporter ATP-binding protein [Candidatus Hydrogenedentota bacterium]